MCSLNPHKMHYLEPCVSGMFNRSRKQWEAGKNSCHLLSNRWAEHRTAQTSARPNKNHYPLPHMCQFSLVGITTLLYGNKTKNKSVSAHYVQLHSIHFNWGSGVPFLSIHDGRHSNDKPVQHKAHIQRYAFVHKIPQYTVFPTGSSHISELTSCSNASGSCLYQMQVYKTDFPVK